MFTVGRHVIDPPVVLAPMEGVTDRAFRGVIRGLGGCGLTVTEFVSSEALTREVRAAWRMAEVDPDEHPVSIQIYGRDPERMAQAARFCQGLGADIVDINLGCPSKRVTSGCAGSALMREPERTRRIFDAVYDAISIPMTVKMRLGWDLDVVNAPEIAREAQDAGARMVTVHGRSRMCMYKGAARWDLVRQVRNAIDIPLLVNGDIVDAASARQALAQSGADGVMIGRAVMTDPWTLARVSHELHGTPFHEPSWADRRALLDAYIDRMSAFGEIDRRALGKLRRVLGYLVKGIPNGARLRQELNSMRDLSHAKQTLDVYITA